MKILVATKETQGQRGNDFCFADEGEPVLFGSECDNEPVDGSCGCRRAMAGMKSGKGTTTFKVIDSPEVADRQALEKMVQDSLTESGWINGSAVDEEEKMVQEITGQLFNTAEVFEIGKVLEKRGQTIQVREVKHGRRK